MLWRCWLEGFCASKEVLELLSKVQCKATARAISVCRWCNKSVSIQPTPHSAPLSLDSDPLSHSILDLPVLLPTAVTHSALLVRLQFHTALFHTHFSFPRRHVWPMASRHLLPRCNSHESTTSAARGSPQPRRSSGSVARTHCACGLHATRLPSPLPSFTPPLFTLQYASVRLATRTQQPPHVATMV